MDAVTDGDLDEQLIASAASDIGLERASGDPAVEVLVLCDARGDVVHLPELEIPRTDDQTMVVPGPGLGELRSTAARLCRQLHSAGADTLGAVAVSFTLRGSHHALRGVAPVTDNARIALETATGIDIKELHRLLHSGKTLGELGLTQDAIRLNRRAVRCDFGEAGAFTLDTAPDDEQFNRVAQRAARVLSELTENKSAHSDDVYTVTAPFAGAVTLLASEHTRVSQGERIAVIEAMKMEVAISAPVSGVVERVAEASSVNGGDVLALIAKR